MNYCKKSFFFFGRACFCLIFIVGGLNNIFNFADVETSFVKLFCEWQLHLEGIYLGEKFIEILLPSVSLFLIIATGVELLGALLILLGVRFGAFLLIIFIIPMTLFTHPFWLQVGQRYDLELIMFLKNVSILGALILFSLGIGTNKEKEKT